MLTCASHAIREFFGQSVARLSGLAIYSTLAPIGGSTVRIANGIVGAGAACRISYLIASRQIGTDSTSQRVAVGACTLVGTLIGGVITSLGSNQIVAGVAAGSLFTAAASLRSTCATTEDDKEKTKNLKSMTATGITVTAIGVASWADSQWQLASTNYPARNLGLVLESTVIEVCKASFEKLGPSVNRNVLNFEGKVLATMLGMAPYVAATVLLNGYVASQMRPSHDTAAFSDLAAPLLVGAVANAIRGATNAFVVFQLHQHDRFVADKDAEVLQTHEGIQCPEPEPVVDKSCIRYLLSACRNAIYARLLQSGMSVEHASETAQAIYACYAQCRDLIHDIARGEGWSEPRMVQRSSIELATA
jgi:hypothetical protein